MKEFHVQKKGNTIIPHTQEDLDMLNNFLENQVIRIKAYGTKKERSLTQLGLLHACMKVIADNTNDEEWNTVPKVKFQIKIRLKYVDMEKSVFVDGAMHFHYRSFSFNELEHMEANNVFSEAFQLMADKIQVTKEKLIQVAQERMQRRF